MNITYLQLTEDADSLAKTLPKNKYNYVFGIPTGGIIPAYIISEELKASMLSIKEFTEGNFPKNAKILVVDDLIDGGNTIKKFNPEKKYDVAVIYRKEHSPKDLTTYFYREMSNEWLSFPHEKDNTGIEEHIERILEYIGEDTNREGLIDTPKRVAKMYGEIFRGYKKENKPKITTFLNGQDGITYDQMILDEGDFFSCCEHHMIPFFGKYYFAYIPHPKGKILGLSKVARVVDYYSAKLQIQERLVQDIVKELWNAIDTEKYSPLGMALVMKGEHLCKTMRGAKKKGKMVTAELRGIFKEEAKARDEFYKLISI